MLCRQRGDDAKQPTKEGGQTTSRTSDWCREHFRCPAVQDGVEHALEEVFHDVETDVGGLVVDGAEDED